jgi:hypothetical protein
VGVLLGVVAARGLLDRQIAGGQDGHAAACVRRDLGVPEQPVVGGDVNVDAPNLVRVGVAGGLAACLEGAPDLGPDLLGRADEQRRCVREKRLGHPDHLHTRSTVGPYRSRSP